MQFPAGHAGGGVRAQRIFWKDGRAGETELVEPPEFLLQVLLRLTELATVALVENEHYLLVVHRQVTFAVHQVVELLDCGDDDLVVILVQIALEPGGALRAVHTIGRKALVFLHGLVIRILAVHHEEHLVDELQLGSQARRLEAGAGLA